jgi:hypothetical protein
MWLFQVNCSSTVPQMWKEETIIHGNSNHTTYLPPFICKYTFSKFM